MPLHHGCLFVFLTLTTAACAEDEAVVLKPAVKSTVMTAVEYRVSITGEISTPHENGVRSFPLSSSGEFRFSQQQVLNEQPGAFALQAVRKFAAASTQTIVGKDHATSVTLPLFYRDVNVVGADTTLLQWNTRRPLPGKYVDLLQMPFDVLAVQELLTASPVELGDKWNVAEWVTPMLVGVDAVVEQSMTCELLSCTPDEAVVEFEGMISGAIRGSATDATFNGKFTVDRGDGIVSSFASTQNEKRSPGPVSPGLDVVAKIHWTQRPDEKSQVSVVEQLNEPSEEALLLLLETPLKLRLKHSRDWHLFHETPAVLMMRQLRNGKLVAQCNISPGVTVPPGQHTPDREFRADVEASVRERKGRVTDESTVRDENGWRIRRVRAVGDAEGTAILWDYYLCAAASGEQFSIVFSYSEGELRSVEVEAQELLSTLQIVRRGPALPYR